jgi:hypothetical protein
LCLIPPGIASVKMKVIQEFLKFLQCLTASVRVLFPRHPQIRVGVVVEK